MNSIAAADIAVAIGAAAAAIAADYDVTVDKDCC